MAISLQVQDFSRNLQFAICVNLPDFNKWKTHIQLKLFICLSKLVIKDAVKITVEQKKNSTRNSSGPKCEINQQKC